MSKNGSIYKKSVRKWESQKSYLKIIQEINQHYVAEDIKRSKGGVKYTFNDEIFLKGIKFAESGLSLEEAPIDLRNDACFTNGFKRGQRIQLINQQLYDLGKEYCLKEIPLSKAPENYIDNEYFIAGYNDTMNNEKQR